MSGVDLLMDEIRDERINLISMVYNKVAGGAVSGDEIELQRQFIYELREELREASTEKINEFMDQD